MEDSKEKVEKPAAFKNILFQRSTSGQEEYTSIAAPSDVDSSNAAPSIVDPSDIAPSIVDPSDTAPSIVDPSIQEGGIRTAGRAKAQ